MTQRLTQAKLIRYQRALSALIAAVHDARKRFSSQSKLRPGRLCGTSRFVKELAMLNHSTDYSVYEVQLKRRLVRASHLLHGRNINGENNFWYALSPQMPAVYAPVVEAYDAQARELLRALADVNIADNHEPQKSVREIRAGL